MPLLLPSTARSIVRTLSGFIAVSGVSPGIKMGPLDQIQQRGFKSWAGRRIGNYQLSLPTQTHPLVPFSTIMAKVSTGSTRLAHLSQVIHLMYPLMSRLLFQPPLQSPRHLQQPLLLSKLHILVRQSQRQHMITLLLVAVQAVFRSRTNCRSLERKCY